MAKRLEICKELMSYIGTPYHHQARLPGVGLDCAGVPVCIAKKFDLHNGVVEDMFGYSRIPDGTSLMETLRKGTAKEKSLNELKIADIILFKFLNNPQHLGIYMPDNKIIHSYSVIGKVVLHNFDEKWKNRVVSVFEFFNIEE